LKAINSEQEREGLAAAQDDEEEEDRIETQPEVTEQVTPEDKNDTERDAGQGEEEEVPMDNQEHFSTNPESQNPRQTQPEAIKRVTAAEEKGGIHEQSREYVNQTRVSEICFLRGRGRKTATRCSHAVAASRTTEIVRRG
jgi:hypothetical protein